MRVLVCDDDATVRLVARRMLEEQFGCTVVECTDGVEALTALSARRCSFAILDVDMPGMSGLETLEEIRHSDAIGDLPVIILTAERDEQTVLKLLQLGVAGYIVKPLRHSNFVAKVDALLRTLPPEHANGDATVIDASGAALVADGDPGFRTLLADQIRTYGQVVQADSGAAALVAFRKSPARVVFIGSNLGVMSPERVATRMREAKPWGLRLVRIVDHADEAAGDLFDGFLVRSTSPTALREGLQPYVQLDTGT